MLSHDVHPVPRLLVVEDDPDTAELVIESLGAVVPADRIRHAASVGAALQVDVNSIDMVLTDMNLPDGTGLDLLSMLLARRPDLPIVMVTGEGILDNAFEAIRRGAYDYVVKFGDYLFAIPVVVEKNLAIWRTKQHNRVLQAQLTQTLEALQVKNQALEEAIARLETVASTDPLTMLANRRAFNEGMNRSFAEAARYGHDLACLMIDLDGFKRFNDTLGHQRGDQLLQLVARIMKQNSRRSDLAGRFGGDEFILLMPQTDMHTARLVSRRMADQLRAAMLDMRAEVGDTPSVTMSMGLSCLREARPINPDQMISQADQALYAAKQSGKARLVIYGISDHRAAVA